MKLSREQRKRLVDGDYAPLFFADEPDCKKGSTYTLTRVKESRSHVGDGQVAVTPAQATRWLTVTAKVRKETGWLVTFTVTDKRDTPRLMAIQNGQAHPEQYTTSRHRAIEDAEGVDEFSLKRYAADAKARDVAAVGELLATLEDLRSAVKERMEGNPDAVRIMGRDAWALRSKIDAVERRLKRRMAA